MSYEPFDKQTAAVEDRIARALYQIMDEDAPMRWTRYRSVAACIAFNPKVMADLQKLAKKKRKEVPEPTRDQLEAFIQRAGFKHGWENLESWARRMAEQAVKEQT